MLQMRSSALPVSLSFMCCTECMHLDPLIRLLPTPFPRVARTTVEHVDVHSSMCRGPSHLLGMCSLASVQVSTQLTQHGRLTHLVHKLISPRSHPSPALLLSDLLVASLDTFLLVLGLVVLPRACPTRAASIVGWYSSFSSSLVSCSWACLACKCARLCSVSLLCCISLELVLKYHREHCNL